MSVNCPCREVDCASACERILSVFQYLAIIIRHCYAHRCVGVIEGIVPALLDTDGAGLSPEALRVRRAIGGCAVFVEPDALQQLILTT